MNVNDSEIACAVLEKAGYVRTNVETEVCACGSLSLCS